MRFAVILAGSLAAVLALPAAAKDASVHLARPTLSATLRVTVTDRAGLSELALPAPARGGYQISQDGDKVTIALPPGKVIGPVALPPHNVVSITSSDAKAEIVLEPGTTVRTRHFGRAILVEMLDPPHRASPLPAKPVIQAPPPIRLLAAPPPPAQDPVAVTALPVQAEPLPAPAVAQLPALAEGLPIEPAAGVGRPAILLHSDGGVGLAALRIGGEIVIILDAAINFQPPGPAIDQMFAQMTSQRGQDMTVVRVPLATPGTLHFAHVQRGWLVVAGPAENATGSIVPQLVESAPGIANIRLPASKPSRVVTVLDPQTGNRLLVGTQASPGEAVLNERHEVQFSLRPALQGVIVVPVSDDIRLRREDAGFVLSAGPHDGNTIMSGANPQATGQPAASPASLLFDIPNDSTVALKRMLDERVRFAGNSPALARSGPRLRVAETMLALGMDVEAQAVIDVATADDPGLHDLPRAIGLRAVAAILAQRPEDADAIGDARLTGTAEIELWRCLLQMSSDEVTPDEVRGLARSLPVLLGYPAALRTRLLPAALELLALNGQAAVAQAALAKLPDDDDFALVRGMVLEKSGQTVQALQVYNQVAARSDRLPRFKAMVRAVELRIKSGELEARAGADALDQMLFAWRGAHQELPLRLRIAELRREAGQWREALNVLRDGRAAFPADKAQIEQAMAGIFTALLAGDASQRIPPAEFVAIYDQNLDLIQSLPWNGSDGTRLVDRLMALGLQGRAEPIMARMVDQSTDPVQRAFLGARLASLRLTVNDPGGAVSALSGTAPPEGSGDPATMAARQMLYARAEIARGNKDAALGMLQALGTADADDLRADVYSTQKDWPKMVTALTLEETKRITNAAELTADQQALIMRLGVAATLAGDTATVDRLTALYAAVMTKGESATMFRLLASAPVKGTADLPRAYEEIQLARQLPNQLGAEVGR